jgi:hypothetical protein
LLAGLRLTARTTEAALEHANLADGHAVELWEGDRYIALIDAKGNSSTPPATR